MMFKIIVSVFLGTVCVLGLKVLLKPKPTADQLFGCTWVETDISSGECK